MRLRKRSCKVRPPQLCAHEAMTLTTCAAVAGAKARGLPALVEVCVGEDAARVAWGATDADEVKITIF